jgi:predicted peptidase
VNRRSFLVAFAGAVAVSASRLAHAGPLADHVTSVTAITKVFGNGQRMVAVAVAYDRPIQNAGLSAEAYLVEGRRILRVYANRTADLAETGQDGPFVIVELDPEDASAPTYVQVQRDITLNEATASLTQATAVAASDGTVIDASGPLGNTAVRNLGVEDFVQRTFAHAPTGKTINYNLFVPKAYDPAKSYPLVNFMHDAGVTSDNPLMTLSQGLGAVIWADPAEQAKRECFVVAPQFPEQFVNDESEDSPYADLVVDLVAALTKEFSIDTNRLYTTGQSGGGMLSIAISIKYPDFFAASFLVACQWAPEKCKPLATEKMWVVVSEGDIKAFPGQNAIMDVLRAEGATIAQAQWNGRGTPDKLSAEALALEAPGAPILYATFAPGTVHLPGQDDGPGPNHINTWRVAYQIEAIRDWLFKQNR